jgi:hypothetical protein
LARAFRFQSVVTWPCFVAVLHGRKLHLMTVRRKREKEEGAEVPYPLQGQTPSDLIFFHKAPPLNDSTTSQWCHELGATPLACGPLGDI